jgi:hypothetical protein
MVILFSLLMGLVLSLKGNQQESEKVISLPRFLQRSGQRIPLLPMSIRIATVCLAVHVASLDGQRVVHAGRQRPRAAFADHCAIDGEGQQLFAAVHRAVAVGAKPIMIGQVLVPLAFAFDHTRTPRTLDERVAER